MFIGTFTDYELLAINKSKRFDCQTYDPSSFFKKNNVSFALKLLPKILKKKIYAYLIKRLVDKNQQFFYVFFDNGMCLPGLFNNAKRINSAILLRNPLKNQQMKSYVNSAKDLGIKVISFDPADCKKYGLEYSHQFIEISPELIREKPVYDFAFVGKDKGRAQLLGALKNQLEGMGYRCNFIIPDQKDAPENNSLSYEQYLKASLSAKCIIDINQDGQVGLTLRPLEAAIYQRKLLTNNSAIKNYSFYSESNIMVFEKLPLSTEQLGKFLDKQIMNVSKVIESEYSVDNILSKLA